jgi:hypothetical protein
MKVNIDLARFLLSLSLSLSLSLICKRLTFISIFFSRDNSVQNSTRSYFLTGLVLGETTRRGQKPGAIFLYTHTLEDSPSRLTTLTRLLKLNFRMRV